MNLDAYAMAKKIPAGIRNMAFTLATKKMIPNMTNMSWKNR
jgi:hypothetical protein